MFAGFREIWQWNNPIATLAIFTIYMYSVYCGWIITITLFLILLQLSCNYLASQKYNTFKNLNKKLESFRKIYLYLEFMPTKKLPQWKFELNGIQVVFDIARRAQTWFNIAGTKKMSNFF